MNKLNLLVIGLHIIISVKSECSWKCPGIQRFNKCKNYYVSSNDNSSCTRKPDFLISLMDTKNGIVNVTIKGPSTKCNYTQYDVELHANNYKKDECYSKEIDQGNIIIANPQKITVNILDIMNTEEAMQSKMEEKIYFHNVHSGCYMLRIVPYTKIGSCRFTDEMLFFETNFTNPNNNFSAVFNLQDEIMFNELVFKSVFNYDCDNDDQLIELKIVNQFYPTNSAKAILYRNLSDEYEMVVCNQQRTKDFNVKRASLKRAGINCKLTYELQVPDENATYLHSIKFIDGMPCENLSDCEFQLKKPLKVNEIKTSTVSSAPSIFEHYNILIIIGIIILLCSIVVLTLIRNNALFIRNRITLETKRNEFEHATLNNFNILLLYARDCQPFMESMIKLKEILINCGHRTVYDIYDLTNFEDIAADPHGWIWDKLRDDNTKTILVLTQCGLIQTEMPPNCPSVYKSPMCHDNLFLYAMMFLKQNLNCVPYRKFFKVILNSDRTDYSAIDYINPFTRYVLPDNINELLSAISISARSHQHSQLYRKEFFEKCKVYAKFCESNPHYLMNMLNVEIKQDQKQLL